MHMFENKAFNLLNKGKQSSEQELHELVALAIELLKNEDRKINVPVISEMTGISKQALYRSEKIRGLLGTKARSHVRKINIGVVNGKILSKRREILGFSQRDLAKKIDEEQSYISIAENQGLIGKDKLKHLCDILGLDSTKFEEPGVSPSDKLVLEPTLSSYLKFICENYFLKPESVAVNQHEMSSEVEPFDPLLYRQAVNLLVKDKVLVAHAVLADHYYQQELNSLVSQPSSSDGSQEIPQPEEDEEDKFLVIMSGSSELHTVKDAAAAQALIKKLVSTTGFDMSRSFHIYKLVSVASAEVRIVSTDC
ncbi:MAG: hypothetical protein WBH52_21020 [Pseudomonas aeruginosa]